MILIVSGFTEYFVNHNLRSVSVVSIGLSEQVEKMEQDEKAQINHLVGEPCSELLAKKCIGNGYRVTIQDGLATVATGAVQ
ncbi:hypothetical protein ACPV36_19585 [Photobacterium damselae]|uniref:hypothetical protein n=1 Tax=Photobacterium damselae TaxID=38293 RepID=UPI004069727A